MTVQWTAVAAFLYGEVGVLLVLCLPFISPLRWQKIFMIPLWSKMAVFWNKMFLTIIVLLIILFLDAVREVRKYSAIQVNEKVASVSANAIDHIQMKLFRSQRNLYISGFSLFLWLTYLTGAVAQSNATKYYQKADFKKLKEVNVSKLAYVAVKIRGCKKAQLKEIGQLKAELQKTSNALHKANNEVAAVKKQSEGLKREYDRLMKEYERLQVGGSGSLCEPSKEKAETT
uniref:Endoplasmic reticulum transmembrane protein n=1 Tax=Pavo cristatus TaxID=9049 RepID=A0A8C9LFG9_PAVCR